MVEPLIGWSLYGIVEMHNPDPHLLESVSLLVMLVNIVLAFFSAAVGLGDLMAAREHAQIPNSCCWTWRSGGI